MYQVELQNNEFLRQFETIVNGSLARIEYAEQERKIFLTKIVIPGDVNDTEFEEFHQKCFRIYFRKKPQSCSHFTKDCRICET